MSNLILLIILWSFLECAYKKIPIYEEKDASGRKTRC